MFKVLFEMKFYRKNWIKITQMLIFVYSTSKSAKYLWNLIVCGVKLKCHRMNAFSLVYVMRSMVNILIVKVKIRRLAFKVLRILLYDYLF